MPAKAMAAVPPLPQEPVHIEPVLQWQPQWSWVFSEIYQREIEPLPFSTFLPGAEPDVWPVLERTAASNGDVIVVLMSGALAFIFGVMFVRWHSSRIRITRGIYDH